MGGEPTYQAPTGEELRGAGLSAREKGPESNSRYQSLLRDITELVRQAPDKASALQLLESFDPERALLQNPEGSRRPTKGRTFYDRLIGEILERVRQGVSRERLVSSVVDLLQNEKSTDALGYLILEAEVGRDGLLAPVRVLAQSGYNVARVKNFEKNNSSSLSDSDLIRDVMVGGEGIEFLPTAIMRGYSYHGEFDALIDDQKRGAWICAVPLPSADTNQPARMLVALYPVGGSPTEPILPRAAPQEWRVFSFLSVAYALLNHQLSGVADLVALQRREIVADLAPSIVNHEINQQLAILDEGINTLHFALRKLAAGSGKSEDSLNLAASGLRRSYSAIDRLHRIADAFNNLDRRAPNVRVSVRRLLAEIHSLIHPRLARAGIVTEFGGPALDVELVTDPALIEHVFINILANAIDALAGIGVTSERKTSDPTIKIEARIVDGLLSVVLANNGPPFAVSRRQRLFERGVTTKPLGIGHGLGLHVCRLVMSYLGGQIEIAASGMLPTGTSVGFQVLIPLESIHVSDVMNSSEMSRTSGRLAAGKKANG